MAIKAIIETGREIPETRVVELASGEKDEYGKPFTLIRLLAISSDRRGTGARFHTTGFQDAFIHVLDSGIQIKYGPEARGDVMFEKNELGKLIGTVAKTPWNMETLAAAEIGIKDGLPRQWEIMDADIKDEVRSLMNKIKTTATVKAEVNPEAALNHDLEMIKKNEALKLKEKVVVEPEAFLGAAKLIQDLTDPKITSYNNLLARAKATGGWNEKIMKREDLVTVIVAYEASKTKKEDLPVE